MSTTRQPPDHAAAQEDRLLQSAESRLAARYAAELPVEVVRTTLAHAHDELEHRSSVSTYLPVLAERLAAERLAVLAQESRQR